MCLQVDEHDWRHRPSCFKKGEECRFDYGKTSSTSTCLYVEAQAGNDADVTMRHQYNTDTNFEPSHSTPYLVETQLPLGCEFLNSHSMLVSTVFACNTNVKLGELSHLFYAAAYAFKNIEKEDMNQFIQIGTHFCRHLTRMQNIALESAETESESEQESDLSEGLSRILSSMCVNLSKAMCSSPSEHLVMSNSGSRFE